MWRRVCSGGVVVGLTVACGSETPMVPNPAPPPVAPSPVIESVRLSPLVAHVVVDSFQRFESTAHWSNGTSAALGVEYTATGGAIDVGGVFRAGPIPGSYQVIALERVSGLADTSDVIVVAPPSPGYSTEYADDFARYANDAAVRAAYSTRDRKIWNFGGIDWSSIGLIGDPIFGKALRTTQQRQVPFFDLVNAPQGLPGAVQRTRIDFTKGPLSALWVRLYVRFGVPAGHPYGWQTKSPNDPSPLAGAYKVFFLHWNEPYSERGALVFSNNRRLDAQFYVTGLLKVTETRVPGSGPEQGLNAGDGSEFRDGEWYEMVYHYRRLGGNIAEAGAWVRRYSRRGVVDPDRYRWWAGQVEFAGPPPTAAFMELGGNKNHGNEYDQYVIWGPWQVVDGDKHENPFSVPMR